MRFFRFPFAFAVLAIGASLACSSEAPTSVASPHPTATGAGPTPASPPRSFAYPPLARPGEVFERETSSSIPGTSRMVLYADGSFSLQYLRPDWGFFEYKGVVSRLDGLVTFQFADWNLAGPWVAEGAMQGNTLRVTFNRFMILADFEDGVYRSAAVPPTVARVFVANIDGSGRSSVAIGGWPSWSPDGRRIAFHRDGRIYMIGADGSDETFLASGQFPAWAPDGRRIAFVDPAGLSVITLGGTGSATLLLHHGFRTDTYASSDLGIRKPTWSPDGTRIAFEHAGDGDTAPAAIFVVKADGSQPRPLTNRETGDTPRAIPRGRRMERESCSEATGSASPP